MRCGRRAGEMWCGLGRLERAGAGSKRGWRKVERVSGRLARGGIKGNRPAVKPKPSRGKPKRDGGRVNRDGGRVNRDGGRVNRVGG